MWLPNTAFKNAGTNFYSHIPCGMWQYAYDVIKKGEKFLLTHPVWDVTVKVGTPDSYIEISTHTSRVGCDEKHLRWRLRQWISTHTSRVGCDRTGTDTDCPYSNFYSHIPCGMWPLSAERQRAVLEFLLTHPVWDVTEHATVVSRATRISTHTSRVGCDSYI